VTVGHIKLGVSFESDGGPPAGSWGTVGFVHTVGNDDEGYLTVYAAIFDHPQAMAPGLPPGTWLVQEDEIAEKRECCPGDGICS